MLTTNQLKKVQLLSAEIVRRFTVAYQKKGLNINGQAALALEASVKNAAKQVSIEFYVNDATKTDSNGLGDKTAAGQKNNAQNQAAATANTAPTTKGKDGLTDEQKLNNFIGNTIKGIEPFISQQLSDIFYEILAETFDNEFKKAA